MSSTKSKVGVASGSRSTRRRGWLPTVLAWGAVVGCSAVGCGPTAAPGDGPTLEATGATAGVAAAKASAPADPRAHRLDAFSNLRGSGSAELGFEIPVGAERLVEGVRGPVFYVEANKERLVRFFRSRGHSLLERSDGLDIRHTDRTLRAEPDVSPDALIRASQGPGPGWTLRFDKGVPTPLAQPALLELIAAETPLAAESAPDEAPSKAAETERPGQDGERLEDAQGTPGATKAASRGTGSGGISGADRAALEAAALGRKVDPKRGRDQSQAIYEYVKANPGRGFLD
jgi:hypothetical protein